MHGHRRTGRYPPTAGRREWLGLTVLALPTLLLSLDMSVLYLALPHLSADLDPSATQSLWIMDIYGFMIAGFLVTMGTLGDRIGRRRLLLIGAAAFGVASVLAAYAPSAETLIAARALLGIAGATLMPSTLALISNMFLDPRQRASAIGLWMTCFMVGSTIGPLVGGTLLELFWWGSVFLLGVPIMLLLLVTAPVLLPEYRDKSAGKVDLVSAVMSLVAVLSVIYGLKHLAEHGISVTAAVAVVLGVAVGVVFVRRQRSIASPLMDMRLFGNRSFSGALTVILFGTVVSGGIFLFASQYFQTGEGLGPFQAGLWLVAPALATVLSSMLSPAIARTVRPAYLVASGLVLAASGAVLLAIVPEDGSLALAVSGVTIAFLGFGPMMVLGTDLIVGSAPPERAGSASALSETGSELGIALGVALLGSLGAAVQRGRTSDGATTAEGFIGGMNAVAWACVAILGLLAAVSMALLRHIRPGNEEHAETVAAGDPDDSAAKTAQVPGV
ncbi:MFS transporter [Streptomyces sp. DG2A-72]|uniref:MFS transporter n=1 Tax=Streptomyces sp. DG2A-72 TaxID=3051386 RepID=UPI00265C59F7|nr:MFS transporter [Streptomyces sp. DG2A-72]MDO0939342.1 MFS transporter [Streptomyces sp. DG2A-72]